MRYLGWIISLILAVGFYIAYTTQYRPMRSDVEELQKEIAMWENMLKNEKGLSGDRNRFATERFFQNDKLTPYGEVEILRRFDLTQKGVEMYISAPNAFQRAQSVMQFLHDQRLLYKDIMCLAEIDSIERFEYRFTSD
jgi:hypothetical protein